MSNQKSEEQPVQIQLELPDYSYEYQQYLEKMKKNNEQEETVIIIDLY